MLQTSETRAGKARVSRNSFGCWFRDPLSLPPSTPQAILPLIALHLGEHFLARLAEGCDHG